MKASHEFACARVAARRGHSAARVRRLHDIAAWWRPNGLFEFTPRGPGVLSFEPGGGGRQASFTDGQNTHVEIRFEAVGDGTRVTVEHRGWDSVPQNHVARHHFPDGVFLRHGEWWQALLASYHARVALAERGA